MIFAIHWHKWATCLHVSPHPEITPTSLPTPSLALSLGTGLVDLLHASNLNWSSILHMVIYMFQCYSLISSYPRFFLHSWKFCSLHLCLFCCFVYRVCMDVRVGLWRKLSAKELMLLNCGVGQDSWKSLVLQGDPTSPFWRRSALGFLWKEWC